MELKAFVSGWGTSSVESRACVPGRGTSIVEC